MYEEDRVQALAMYNSMFDETGDETGLLQLLVSPTRQAVNLARSYDAKERKLQAHSQAREAGEKAEEEPAFLQVIERIREQAAALGRAEPKVSDDQFSLFENAELDTSVFDDVAAELEAQPEAPAQETAPLEEAPVSYPDEDAAPAPAETAEDPADEAAEEAPALAEADHPANDAAEEADEVDAFLADFSIQNDELSPAHEQDAPVDAPRFPDEDAAPAPAEAPKTAPASLPDLPPLESSKAEPEKAPAPMFDDLPPRTVRKPRVFLLILYILLAVPVTLLCIGILLLPTLLALALAFTAITLGAAGFGAAFGSFSVFADILLVLGCALVVLALGLLLAWTFIWFVFGAIPGLIRGVFALGRKLCYKEVPVQ